MRAIFYDEVGGPEVLYLAEVKERSLALGDVLVQVAAAGINPYDDKVRSGFITSKAPFPRRVGSDLAGTVIAVGPDAAYWDESPILVGDVVLGSGAGSVAEQAIAKAKNLARVPVGLSMETAGSMNVAALTGLSVVTTVPVGPEDTVLVGGASGAVGLVAAQLALQRGANVLGTASQTNFGFLESLGVEPILYGAGLEARVAEQGPITAVMDCHGREALDVGAQLGVPGRRMVATAAYDALAELGAKSVERAARTAENLETLAAQVADSELVFPVVANFPLEEVVEAFTALRGSHAPGKIVVTP